MKKSLSKPFAIKYDEYLKKQAEEQILQGQVIPPLSILSNMPDFFKPPSSQMANPFQLPYQFAPSIQSIQSIQSISNFPHPYPIPVYDSTIQAGKPVPPPSIPQEISYTENKEKPQGPIQHQKKNLSLNDKLLLGGILKKQEDIKDKEETTADPRKALNKNIN